MRYLTLVLLGMMVGCASAPTAPTAGDEIFSTDFSVEMPFNVVRGGGSIDSGMFKFAQDDNTYAWAVADDNHTNVIIDAETSLITDSPNNGYGVGCRMSEDGSGYYFLVSRDGYYAILLGTAQSVSPITEWAKGDNIAIGAGAQNNIRAVCNRDYLALYVNDKFLAEVNDERHQSGATGVLISGGAEGRSEVGFVQVHTFDIAAME